MTGPTELALSGDQEPVAALSSGRDAAAIAVVRMTGLGCLKLAEACIRFLGNRRPEHGRMRLCQVFDPESEEVIDQPAYVFFKGPSSYTGQDSLELFLHGGPFLVGRVLSLLWACGFRPAEPGEFTRRAYLNGKMDLTGAEGIRALVEAASEQEWMAARHLASGRLRAKISGLREKVLSAMAWLEARIDFPDEAETSLVGWQDVDERIAWLRGSVAELLSSFDSGRVASQGLKVTLFGLPNAGKSTLMNTLLGQERAIVTDVPGTTRDYIEERCLVLGRLIRLTDTAGVRTSTEQVEHLGIERSLALARESDVVLSLIPSDGSARDLEELKLWQQQLRGPVPCLNVLTKADLPQPSWLPVEGGGWLTVSCREKKGITELRQRLAHMVDQNLKGLRKKETFITSPRHRKALEDAIACLDRFIAARQGGAFEEMLAFELQDLSRSLGSIIGEVSSDEVLGVVFSSFCVGK